MERLNHYRGVNLYVKILMLPLATNPHNDFFLFGTITSVKVMIEGGKGKRFGFVCFSSPEEVTKAVTEMNWRIVGTKPL